MSETVVTVTTSSCVSSHLANSSIFFRYSGLVIPSVSSDDKFANIKKELPNSSLTIFFTSTQSSTLSK